MKIDKYYTVGIFPKSNRKIVQAEPKYTTFLSWYRRFNKKCVCVVVGKKGGELIL